MTRALHRLGLVALAMAFTAVAGCQKAAAPHASDAAATATPPGPAPAPAVPAGWVPTAPNPTVNVSLDMLPTQPHDIPDSHDIAFLKRFQGAAIIGYVARPYDKLTFYSSNEATWQEANRLTLEGQITRVVYRIPPGHTALEVLRNYEDLAKAAGLAQTSEQPCAPGLGSPPSQMYEQLRAGQLDNPVSVGGTNPDSEQPHCYFTARGVANGRALMVAVGVAEKHKFLTQTGFDGKPLAYKDGEIIVILDLVAAKPVGDQMVTVRAADMADALATKGVIDLYGVYFDTDKIEVKPDSAATLGEIASLLKIDRSLKLEVSGHTDNTGAHDHNLALSQGRAQSVVQSLVKQYGVDPARLVAKGYGDSKPVAPNTTEDGKARNRRVELRKL